jgi:hypothetical protein
VGKGTKQNFFKGKSPNGKKKHEKLLTIPGQSNANHYDFTSLLLELLPSRKPATRNVGKDVAKKEPSHTASENIS